MNPEPASYRGQTTEDKEAQKQAHTCIRVSWNWAWCKSCVRTNDGWTKPSKYTSEHFMKNLYFEKKWIVDLQAAGNGCSLIPYCTKVLKTVIAKYRASPSRYRLYIADLARLFLFSDVFPMKYHYNDIRARGMSSLQRNIATAIYVGRGCVIAIYRSSDITL